MSVQLTVEQETKLADLAQARDLTLDDLAQEAVERFLREEEAHRVAIERSRAQIAAGKTKSHEEVFANLKQRMGW